MFSSAALTQLEGRELEQITALWGTPLPTISKQLALPRVCRFLVPWKQENQSLGIILAYPIPEAAEAEAVAKGLGPVERVFYPSQLVRLYYYRLVDDKVVDCGAIPLDMWTMTDLFSFIAQSEIFSIPEAKMPWPNPHFEYGGPAPIHSGWTVAERYLGGDDLKVVTRMEHASAPATFLAERLRNFVARALEMKNQKEQPANSDSGP